MARYMTLDAYKAALEEATDLIARSHEHAAHDDERLDWLLHKIVCHPPAFEVQAEDTDGSEALLARLQADVEAFVRRRAEDSLSNWFPPREHGIGPTLGPRAPADRDADLAPPPAA